MGTMNAGVEAMGGGLFSALGVVGNNTGRESNASGGTVTGSDEEGLGLLRQQLSAVQRIRIEHERKDATIAALRLEVRSCEITNSLIVTQRVLVLVSVAWLIWCSFAFRRIGLFEK